MFEGHNLYLNKKNMNLKRSQSIVLGSIIIISFFIIGILIFFYQINKNFEEKSEELAVDNVKAKALEIANKLDVLIKTKGEVYLIWDIKDFKFKRGRILNYSYLTIEKEFDSKIYIEKITNIDPYYELCEIDSTRVLRYCVMEGISLRDLTQNWCSLRNNIYYCEINRIYSVKNISGIKYLYSILPVPKLNEEHNKLCNVYKLKWRGNINYFFVCDYYLRNGYCYFPSFEGQFVAFNPTYEEKKKVRIYYDGIEEFKNPYPLICKKAYKLKIKFELIG